MNYQPLFAHNHMPCRINKTKVNPYFSNCASSTPKFSRPLLISWIAYTILGKLLQLIYKVTQNIIHLL